MIVKVNLQLSGMIPILTCGGQLKIQFFQKGMNNLMENFFRNKKF